MHARLTFCFIFLKIYIFKYILPNIIAKSNTLFKNLVEECSELLSYLFIHSFIYFWQPRDYSSFLQCLDFLLGELPCCLTLRSLGGIPRGSACPNSLHGTQRRLLGQSVISVPC